MLTAPVPETVPVTVAGHVFTFRRLTWRDELRLHALRQKDSKMQVLAYALSLVDGRPVRLDDARSLVSTIPRPIRERLVILYRGSLPNHRLLETKIPYRAPKPRVMQVMVEEETESAEQRAEEFLEQKFGREAVAEAQAQAEAIARHSDQRNLVKPVTENPEGEEGEEGEEGDGLESSASRYHSVM